jgi:hypothetical protein
MKLRLMTFCLFASLFSSSVLAGVRAEEQLREATASERAFLVQQVGEEHLRGFLDSFVRVTEISTYEEALITEAMAKGAPERATMDAYIQSLTNLGLNDREIDQKIEALGRTYFAELQLRDLVRIFSQADQEKYARKFADLQKRYEAKSLTLEELDREILKLGADISASPVTIENERKVERFKTDLIAVAHSRTFVRGASANKQKKLELLKVRVPKEFSLNESGSKPLFHQAWFAWGYNRDFHSKTDVQFTTKDDTFVIHDAVGHDRPSDIAIRYLAPDQFSIPQYNFEIGVMFNEHWGVDLHWDHMKYVFDNKLPYEITGNYSHQVVTSAGRVDFSEAAANRDATWLNFEHTDGFNYLSLGAVYNQSLLRTRNNRFAIDARVGAGGGLMIPRTEVFIRQDNPTVRYGIDNKFHIAGFGVHGDARLRFTFWNSVFLQASTRASLIKVSNALVDGADARLEHIQPVRSIQYIGQIGYTHTFGKKKAKKRK